MHRCGQAVRVAWHAVCRASFVRPADATWDVPVIGGAHTDYVVRGPRLPTKNLGVQGAAFHEFPGGKGFNQAVAAARLEARISRKVERACSRNDGVLLRSATARMAIARKREPDAIAKGEPFNTRPDCVDSACAVMVWHRRLRQRPTHQAAA
jgi:hypothetical protein